MKLPGAKAGAAIDRPDPAIRLFLLSGNDPSTGRLLAERLRKSLNADKSAMTAAQLKSEPRLLADEAASLSMFGDRRLLWIEPASEDILPAVTALLDLEQTESLAVALMPGAFRKTSALQKLADSHPAILHLICEPRSARELSHAVMELALAEGLRVAPPLAERIASEAAGDLILARLELQKFALYLGALPSVPQDLDEEVVDLLGIDQAQADFTGPGDAALAGDVTALADQLALLDSGNVDPIPVVRALQRRLLMLAPLRARIDQGQSAGTVVAGVWKRDRDSVARILPRWTSSRLSTAFEKVQRLERELLLKPVPPRAALGETLFQLARAARR